VRSIAALLVSFSLIALTIAPATAAGGDKTLQNLHGQVSYSVVPNGPTTPVAADAAIALSDNYSAITGAASEGSINLPDSSRVLVGQNSNVQLAKFDQAGIATARFVVAGKVRFTVQHPAGAHANYTFQTTTAQIAVRGTVGDIWSDPSNLQVNCYALSDPTLPIQVTLNDGEVFTLGAGQSLVVHLPLDPANPPHVQNVTHPLADTFSEFGLPDNARELGLLSNRGWLSKNGWLGLILVPIILILTNQHPPGGGPASGTFPIGVSGHIQH
jgi:ferric-dicitrate binding protein FerR (iron transport regulator)